MKTWEGNHVDSKLSEIAIELSRETERTCSSSNGIGNQVVKISIAGVGKLESTEANIIESFVIESKALVRILDKLMNRKSSVVRFNDSIRHLGRGNNTVCTHDTIRVLFTNLGNKQSSHSSSSSSSHGMGNLESLKHIAGFTFLTHDIHNVVNKFCSFRVMTFCPVVSCARLSKDKVIRSKECAIFSSTNRIHGSRFKIGKNGTRNIASCLPFIVVHVDTF
mmetsp:Transcript_14538/g.26319  ORF Transcript_14538/g.26319 Transcript_14538/m.26319 type:complete len:221 (+) Transcript_14538:745-1407(+)